MLAAALVLPACDGAAKKDDASNKDDATAKSDADAAPNKDEAAAKDAPEGEDKPAADDRVLAESGFAVGGRFNPFVILNGETDKKYCQVCSYGPAPKIMAVGTADDEAFHKDLKDLDAIVKKYGDDKVKAFAVVTSIEGGKATVPSDPDTAKADAAALKAKLGVSFPVVVPAPDEDGKNPDWDKYNITKSRTVMFSDGKNNVKFSAVAPEDFADLGKAIEEVIG